MKKGMSTVHGSQHFQHPDGLLEVLKKHKHKGENRGHSIGYNQHSTDSNGLVGSGKYPDFHQGLMASHKTLTSETRCQNMKEQMIRSRPTSSSSNFMYINPLIGVNQKYHNHMKFQPLEEDIPEEKERRKRNWKNTRKKLKKKKKIIRCKPAKADEGASNRHPEESDNGENEEDNVQEDINYKSKLTERQTKKYNNLKYDEADSKL